jgi:hypothetical protein
VYSLVEIICTALSCLMTKPQNHCPSVRHANQPSIAICGTNILHPVTEGRRDRPKFTGLWSIQTMIWRFFFMLPHCGQCSVLTHIGGFPHANCIFGRRESYPHASPAIWSTFTVLYSSLGPLELKICTEMDCQRLPYHLGFSLPWPYTTWFLIVRVCLQKGMPFVCIMWMDWLYSNTGQAINIDELKKQITAAVRTVNA